MTQPDPTDSLRVRAEERLQDRALPVERAPQSAADAPCLLHELQVHQVELELQNEELKSARDAAEEAAARYTDLYDFAPVSYLTLNRKGDITQANLACAQLLGVARVHLVGKRLGKWLTEAAVPAFNAFLAQAFVADAPPGCELALHVNGQTVNVQIDAGVSDDGQACRLVLVDITARTLKEQELAQSQKQLLQSEKMATVGQLAAGVAHEINNPIGFVNSNLHTLQEYVRDLIAVTDAYEQMEAAVQAGNADLKRVRQLKEDMDFTYVKQDLFHLMAESREGLASVASIVKDLKDFAHPSEDVWARADLHQCLDSTLNMAKSAIKYKADVEKNYGQLPTVLCVATQLNQVFVNLLVNASHAIAERGKITIATGVAPSGQRVWIEISDTGQGIAEKNLTHIFEPFFTTKPLGQGTGLGLSLSWGIVERHHGAITVKSTVGVGTTFRIELPVGDRDQPVTGDA